MTNEEFANLKIGDRVVFVKKFKDMPNGWNHNMDAYINTPALVINISFGDVRIKTYNSNHIWTFRYEYLEVYEKKNIIKTKFEPLSVNDVFIQQIKEISLNIIKNKIFKTDFIYYKKIHQNVWDQKIIENILKKCPRLIGVVLSNNYFKVVK